MKRVYFIRPVGKAGPIKIGCSEDPDFRLFQLAQVRGEPLRLIASAPGSFTDECRIHRQLASDRTEGEWFEPSAAVMAVVDYVLDTGVLPPAQEEDRVEVMKRLYVGGLTLQAIGDRFGMTRERVRQILRKHDCPSFGIRAEHRRKAEPLSPDEVEFARLYRDGVCPAELKIRFPKLHCANVLKRAGVAAHPPGHWLKHPEHNARLVKVLALYDAGVTSAEIATQAGLAHQTAVYRYLRMAGVKPRRRGRPPKLTPSIVQAIKASYEAGHSKKHIAAEFNISTPTVGSALRTAGVVITRADVEARRIAAVKAANARRAA